MKILFWISALVVCTANFFLLQGFINVYYKNYNGGPESSSGSIWMPLAAGIIILLSGLVCYFTGHEKIALAVMGIPILLVLLYMFVMIILPVLLGGRMN